MDKFFNSVYWSCSEGAGNETNDKDKGLGHFILLKLYGCDYLLNLNEVIYLKQYVGMLNREVIEEEDDWTDASKDNLSILKKRKFANTYLNDWMDYKSSENNEVEEEK